MSELEREVLPPERWDYSLPKAFEDFKDIEIDSDRLDLPIDVSHMENDAILSICMLNSLGVTRDMRKFPYPNDNIEKFRRIYHERLEGEDFESINASIRNYNYNQFYPENMRVNDPEDKREVWRELISYSIIYSLDSQIRDQAIKQLDYSESAYEVVKIFFKS